MPEAHLWVFLFAFMLCGLFLVGVITGFKITFMFQETLLYFVVFEQGHNTMNSLWKRLNISGSLGGVSDGLLKVFAATEQTLFSVSAGCLCCPPTEGLVCYFALF